MFRRRTVNVGVIGMGNMGQHHARIFSKLPQANLIAICDSHQKMGEKIAKKFKCTFYEDYKKMLVSENLEAVSIAVPTRFHKKVAIDSIRAGKHVLVEKPISSTINQGEQIIRVAKKRGVILTVGHVERFNPAVRKLKELIDRKNFGQIISITTKRVGPFVPWIKDAGVLIDLAVHDIDIINYLLKKEPEKIYVNGGKAIGDYKEDYADILLDYGSASGYVQVNWITPIKIRKLYITGTKSYAELDYVTQKLDLYNYKHKTKLNDFGTPIVQFGAPRKTSLPVKFEEPLKSELKSFLINIIRGTTPEVSGLDGLRALKIALKALKNIKHA